jgi:hypothetical protein
MSCIRWLPLVAAAAVLVLGQAHAQPAKASPDPDADKLICKKEAEIGSLVKRKKTCLTQAQWKQVIESNQRGARRMIEEATGRPSGTDPLACYTAVPPC